MLGIRRAGGRWEPANRARVEGPTVKSKKRSMHPPTSLRADGITHVGLKVSDVGRSRRFYRRLLGLRDEPRDPGVVYVPSGRDRLVLYEAGQGMTRFHFGFNVDSPSKVDKWKDWLRKHDVPIHEDIAEDSRYRSIKFRDPDGHWIEISYEP
jgi:catechol 2,3-dioxygenase-like lactoylglutathione lyase family enzyme